MGPVIAAQPEVISPSREVGGCNIKAQATDRATGEGGFTLVEIIIALATLSLAAVALAGVLVTVARARAEVETRYEVLCQAQVIMEAVQGTPPTALSATYNDTTFFVDGVDGTNVDGSVFRVTVDETDPNLIVVLIAGSWDANGSAQGLRLSASIFNSP